MCRKNKPLIKSEYIETIEGRINRYQWRQRRKIKFKTNKLHHLTKKSIRVQEKNNIKKDISTFLKKNNRRPFRSEVAIRLEIHTSISNSPQIQNIVKNIIDLLYPNADDNNHNRLLLKDDSQISYLSVVYFPPIDSNELSEIKAQNHQTISNNISYDTNIDITVYPFNCFLQDLYLAFEIMKHHDSNNYYFNNYKENYNKYKLKYDELIKNINNYEPDEYNIQLNYNLYNLQTNFLSHNRMEFNDIYWIFKSFEKMKNKDQTIFQLNEDNNITIAKFLKNKIVNSPIYLRYPETPNSKGFSTKEYMEIIKKNINDFFSKHMFLKELKVPIELLVLYQPPMKAQNELNDLDNIMLKYIIPPFYNFFNFSKNSKLKKLEKNFVIGYEIFRLRTDNQNNSNGFILISITNGLELRNMIWDATYDTINTYKQKLKIS